MECEVFLRLLLGNTSYRVPFIVVDNLSCPVLIGTKLTNRHVEAIWCRKGRIEFSGFTLPILGRGEQSRPWREQDAKIADNNLNDEDDKNNKDGKDPSIRLSAPCQIPPFTKQKAAVHTRLQGLIVTEPKHNLLVRSGIRVMNSVHEVMDGETFHVLLSNFSSPERCLPKIMVVGYASMSPLAHINLENGAAQELCGIHNIFVTTPQEHKVISIDDMFVVEEREIEDLVGAHPCGPLDQDDKTLAQEDQEKGQDPQPETRTIDAVKVPEDGAVAQSEEDEYEAPNKDQDKTDTIRL